MNESLEFSWPDMEPPSVPVATSEEAAAALPRSRVRAMYERITGLLAAGGGLTADQIEIRLAIPGNTLRPRLKELEAQGLIFRPGRIGRTRSGRRAFVWILTTRGAIKCLPPRG